jgi:hypothetical protein
MPGMENIPKEAVSVIGKPGWIGVDRGHGETHKRRFRPGAFILCGESAPLWCGGHAISTSGLFHNQS